MNVAQQLLIFLYMPLLELGRLTPLKAGGPCFFVRGWNALTKGRRGGRLFQDERIAQLAQSYAMINIRRAFGKMGGRP